MASGNVTHQLTVAIGAALSGSFSSVVSGSTSKINKIGAAIKDMEKSSALGTRSLDKLKMRYNSFLGSLNKRQTIIQKRAFYRSQIMDMLALGAALVAPVKAAMKFETSLSNIAAVVNFPEPDGLKKLGETLTKISLRIPITADELANIAAVGGRFGIALKDLPFFSEEVSKTAKAWGMTAEEASEKIGNLTKTFNISVRELPKHFDAINHLGNLTGATAADILKAINRSGDGLANFKLSIPQAAALTSTIVSFGEGAEQAGTLVGGMLQKLSIAPKLGAAAQKTLRDMGLSAKVLPNMIAADPQKVLDKLFGGLAKLAPEKRSAAMYSIFGRGPSKMVGKLVDNLELYKKNLEYVSNGSKFKGSRDVDYGIVFETTDSKLTLLTNAISAFGREVGTSLLPTIGKVADSITGVLTPVMSWMTKNKELTTTITTAVAGLISFRIATFALGYASTFLFGGLNRLVIVFKGLRLGMALAGAAFRSFFRIGPLAFTSIAWAVYENWEHVRSFFVGIWSSIEPHWLRFKAVMDEYGITDKIITGWNAAKNLFETIWSTAQIHWLQFKTLLDEYGVTEKIIAGWNAVKSLFENIWTAAEIHWLNFKTVMDKYGVIDNIMAAWTSVKNFFTTLWDAALPHWNAFIKKIQALNVADKIMASWAKLKDFFKGIWNDVMPSWNKFTAPLSKIWDGTKSSVSSIGSLFSFAKEKPSITSKLPPLNSVKAATVTKNQNVNVSVNVNASKISDPREVAKQVNKEMKSFNWGYLYDPVGDLP
jgi:TP901 family phage tail tape measure protein